MEKSKGALNSPIYHSPARFENKQPGLRAQLHQRSWMEDIGSLHWRNAKGVQKIGHTTSEHCDSESPAVGAKIAVADIVRQDEHNIRFSVVR